METANYLRKLNVMELFNIREDELSDLELRAERLSGNLSVAQAQGLIDKGLELATDYGFGSLEDELMINWNEPMLFQIFVLSAINEVNTSGYVLMDRLMSNYEEISFRMLESAMIVDAFASKGLEHTELESYIMGYSNASTPEQIRDSAYEFMCNGTIPGTYVNKQWLIDDTIFIVEIILEALGYGKVEIVVSSVDIATDWGYVAYVYGNADDDVLVINAKSKNLFPEVVLDQYLDSEFFHRHKMKNTSIPGSPSEVASRVRYLWMEEGVDPFEIVESREFFENIRLGKIYEYIPVGEDSYVG